MRAEKLFDPGAFPDLSAVRSKWTEIELEQAEFIAAVTEEALDQEIPFRDIKARLAHLMQHLVNHSTYHRGQVALMLRQLGAEPLPTDFHVFLHERGRTAQAGT
jgi:uncharacterized damage-inducible protein DinB